jgi:hypothetical protein
MSIWTELYYFAIYLFFVVLSIVLSLAVGSGFFLFFNLFKDDDESEPSRPEKRKRRRRV